MSANPASIMDHNPVNTCYSSTGGSRGNLGPGGSGAIIVETQESTMAYKAIWAGSISYNARFNSEGRPTTSRMEEVDPK